MANEDPSLNKLLAIVIASALAGVGGSAGYRAAVPSPVNVSAAQLEQIQKQARPDPYTGTEGRLMEDRSLQRHLRQQKQIDENTSHRMKHEIDAQRYIHMILQHEKEIDALKRNVYGHD